jgi:hypothetical protein
VRRLTAEADIYLLAGPRRLGELIHNRLACLI